MKNVNKSVVKERTAHLTPVMEDALARAIYDELDRIDEEGRSLSFEDSKRAIETSRLLLQFITDIDLKKPRRRWGRDYK